MVVGDFECLYRGRGASPMQTVQITPRYTWSALTPMPPDTSVRERAVVV